MVKPIVRIVGLGPSDESLLPHNNKQVIKKSKHLAFRTLRHPAAKGLSENAISFDNFYNKFQRPFVYSKIAEKVIELAKTFGSITYCVPGSVFVAEESVGYLINDNSVKTIIYDAPSCLDLIWQKLQIDPVIQSVQIVNADQFPQKVAGCRNPLLVLQCYSKELLSLIKLSFEEDTPEYAILLKNLGLKNEVIKKISFKDIDRSVAPNHLTSLFIPEIPKPVLSELAELLEIVKTLRVKCPWDAVQTHESLSKALIEEAYEAFDAVKQISETNSYDNFIEELGDLLLQVLMHSAIGSSTGMFNFYDVAVVLKKKLIDRHPHVFGNLKLESAEQVSKNWELIKQQTTHNNGLAKSLPSLILAQKVVKKLSRNPEFSLKTSLKIREPNNLLKELWQVVQQACEHGIDLETELRKSALDIWSKNQAIK